MNAIVCIDKNFAIGYKGKLLERIPEDMKHFRKITMGKPIIMGRKTFESFPKGPLDGRVNIVLTKDISKIQGKEKDSSFLIGKSSYKEVLYLLNEMGDYYKKNAFVIGGASIYYEFLPFCDVLYLTKIDKVYKEVDTYFPRYHFIEGMWDVVETIEKGSYNDINFTIEKWVRKIP